MAKRCKTTRKRKKKTVIIKDTLNNQVWVSGQKRAGGQNSIKFFGKDARQFKTIGDTDDYARKLALKRKGLIYDKYYGRYVRPRRSRR